MATSCLNAMLTTVQCLCVDRAQESIPGTATNTEGALFYHTEADCRNLPCPPYNNNKNSTALSAQIESSEVQSPT